MSDLRDDFLVEVGPSFGEDGFWEVTIWRRSAGSPLGVPIADRAKAERIRDYLEVELADEFRAWEVYRAERTERFRREREARDAAERPARELAARERAKRVLSAPIVDALKCSSCGHVFSEGDEGEAAYECGRCGSRGVGPDERRCDQGCGIFRAKAADATCPDCAEDLETEAVQAADVDGELVEVAS